MVQSGIKKEEYREMTDYWYSRFRSVGGIEFREFDYIIFSNGYATDRPQFAIEWLGLYVKMGKIKWGAEKNKIYYVLKLGKIIKKKDGKK